jgi:hypothetical protein
MSSIIPWLQNCLFDLDHDAAKTQLNFRPAQAGNDEKIHQLLIAKERPNELQVGFKNVTLSYVRGDFLFFFTDWSNFFRLQPFPRSRILFCGCLSLWSSPENAFLKT